MDGTVTSSQPRGVYPAQCDQRGWVRLPPVCSQYLTSFGGPQVFVTSLEDGVVRVYPLPVWRHNEALCATLDPDVASNVMLCAYAWGGDTVVDRRGWIQLSVVLREKLRLGGQPVWIYCFRERLNVSSQRAYQQRLQSAGQSLPDDVKALERLGLR
jgi:hypothetical protein